MAKGGLRSTSFKPEVSGNPGGRPKRAETIEADVKAAARERMQDPLDTRAAVTTDSKALPAARVSAATAMLARGWGKPKEQVEASVAIPGSAQCGARLLNR
jgi:hypothetical protein